jgi:hypothetical protein
MAYRGEDIPIIIEGDSNNDLDVLNFKVVLYPHDDIDNVMIIHKKDMTSVSKNVYSGKISYNETLSMPVGYYSVEILTIGENERRIFKKDGAFTLYDSASKLVM